MGPNGDNFELDLSKGKVAATGGPGDRLGHAFADLISIFSEPAGLAGDQIRLYRREKAVQAAALAKEKIEKSGKQINSLPLKFFVPYLEDVSLEESDELVELWANLLSQAATQDEFDPRANVHRSVLKELSGKDAETFLGILENYLYFNETGPVANIGPESSAEQIWHWLDLLPGKKDVVVDRAHLKEPAYFNRFNGGFLPSHIYFFLAKICLPAIQVSKKEEKKATHFTYNFDKAELHCARLAEVLAPLCCGFVSNFQYAHKLNDKVSPGADVDWEKFPSAANLRRLGLCSSQSITAIRELDLDAQLYARFELLTLTQLGLDFARNCMVEP